MYKKIKNNPLYNFIFRIIAVFILISILWIILVRSYYEDQISKEIHKEVNNHKEKIVELLKFDQAKFHKELHKLDKDHLIEYVEFYNKDQNLLYSYQKDNSLIEIKALIQKLGKLSFETFHELIPQSQENVYLYHQSSVSFENKTIYFKLLMKLDDETRDLIRNDITETLIVIVITILIIFITTFPIVYSQYKSMIEKQKELIQSNVNTLIALGNAVAKRDSDTNEHNYRVTYYSIKLAEALNLEKKQIKSLIKGSFLHDIGKIAISDNILLKPDKLNDVEFETMKTHVIHGVDIVKNVTWLEDAKNVILHHHEKVDGSGYPHNKKADEIPIEAKVFSVVDVFDALTSKRPYKEPFDSEKSFSIIKADINSHFDEKIVNQFEVIYKELHLTLENKTKEELSELFYETLEPYFYK